MDLEEESLNNFREDILSKLEFLKSSEGMKKFDIAIEEIRKEYILKSLRSELSAKNFPLYLSHYNN